MSWKQDRIAATEFVTQLPSLPRPWQVEKLCSMVSTQRGRPLVLHPMNLSALPFGLWLDDGARDHIIYRTGVTGFHRDHIILHELCHLLAGHNATIGDADAAVPIDRLIRRAMSSPYSDRQEDIAEMFASRVLRLANQRRPDPISGFEQRATAMFGAA